LIGIDENGVLLCFLSPEDNVYIVVTF